MMGDPLVIYAEKSVTVNLGEYESQRIGGTLSGIPYPGEEEACLEALHNKLDAYIIKRIVKLAKIRGKDRWTAENVARHFGLVLPEEMKSRVVSESDLE